MGETSRRLRGICILAFLPLFSSGCAYVQLRKSTLRQASTITELQYQQVLNNLAMLSYDPFALPTMLALKNGTAQVADSGKRGRRAHNQFGGSRHGADAIRLAIGSRAVGNVPGRR